VYRATEPEFRRLGLVLSMLDLALERGVVDDDTETVELAGNPTGPGASSAASPGGAGRQVTLPRLVFRRDPAGPPDAEPAAPDLTTRTTSTKDLA
jgi:hypothetical protein